MIQVIPQYQVEWEYNTDKPNHHCMIINARNIMEATDWFNKINHGLKNITKLVIFEYNNMENAQKGFYQP